MASAGTSARLATNEDRLIALGIEATISHLVWG